MKTSILFQTTHLHLDSGECVPAQVRCTPGEPLEIAFGFHASADIVLPERVHIALARADPHVHFRESYRPTEDEYHSDPYKPAGRSYRELIESIENANRYYTAFQGSLAALKGGIWLVGAMGNTPWPPVGEQRWKKTCFHYQRQSWVFTHVWPRMEPGAPMIAEQEEKDFGSTFGGSKIQGNQRREMYLARRGGMISYHNDKERTDETLLEFKQRVNPPSYLLQPLYYDGDSVLAAQRETIALAKEAELRRLLTRHIPTGPALDMILRERSSTRTELPAEVGLDYLYFNRDMLKDRATRLINYRRPALPSETDQRMLIELTREQAAKRDPLTFIGSDHAPHPKHAKAFSEDGLPGSPGTRVIEHSLQIHTHLIEHHGFTHQDIDWLAAAAPARYIAQYRSFPYPVGSMKQGSMANLVIFDPDLPYKIDETEAGEMLRDPEYHTAYRDETLRGTVFYTVVNGVVFDVQSEIHPINASIDRLRDYYSAGL